MDGRRALEAVLRRWWLVMALPLAVLIGTLLTSASQPYVASVRATVLLPGDTQETGNADDPSRMLMDSAPLVIESNAFARAVASELPRSMPNGRLDAADVESSLSARYYSYVLTVEARRDDAQEALAIARAVQEVLGDSINQYLVGASGQTANVQIIDPPGRALRDGADRALVVVVQTVVALVVGLGLAALAGTLDERLYNHRDVALALALPVLADLRGHRRGSLGPGAIVGHLPRWRR